MTCKFMSLVVIHILVCFPLAKCELFIDTVSGKNHHIITTLTPARRTWVADFNPHETLYFKIDELEINTEYELKLSYPASIPSSFSLRLHTRRLNTAKLLISSDVVRNSAIVSVTSIPEGTSSKTNLSLRKVRYSLSLEPTIMKIPSSAINLVPCLLLTLLIGFKVVAPLLRKLFQSVVQKSCA